MRADVSGTAVAEAGDRLYRFMGLELVLKGSVLAPRPETELLARRAIDLLAASGNAAALVIDMCCGSGNVGLAIASTAVGARLFCADLTEDTCETARENATRLGLTDRVTVCRGDLFGALQNEGLEGKVAMIVCNPPYISTGRLEGESAHLLENEPREAFDGGPYGISIQQRLVREAPTFLTPGGLLLFEFGAGQERQAQSLLTRSRVFECLDFSTDEEGRPRVAVARLKDPAE
jgi:release factor glutamine methyltransferase